MKFISPKCEQPFKRGKYKILCNRPVNIDLCTGLERCREKWYPDNEGVAGILFLGCKIKWFFGSDEERDNIFDLLKTNKYDVVSNE